MKNISKAIIAVMLLSFISVANAGLSEVDRKQLQTQIEIRNIQIERYKMERQMMLDLNDIKNNLNKSPSQRKQLEDDFPMLEKDKLSYDALKESRNAD